jgi:hypothetical protein
MVNKKEIKTTGSSGGNIAENTAFFQELKEIKSDVKELKKFLMVENHDKQEKEQLKKRLIEAYKRQANKNLQSELSL